MGLSPSENFLAVLVGGFRPAYQLHTVSFLQGLYEQASDILCDNFRLTDTNVDTFNQGNNLSCVSHCLADRSSPSSPRQHRACNRPGLAFDVVGG